jgi:hypothetical protein
MTQILEPPAAAMRTWKWCQEAFAENGIKLTFPKNTNPQKTYQWRYITKLTQRIDEWELDRATAKAFIYFSVSYMKEKKLLHKGLSVFFQGNMADVCYDRMQKQLTNADHNLERIRNAHTFVMSRCNNKSAVALFLNRESFGKLRNIVRWYKSGDITDAYLATSLACTEALSKLSVIAPNERDLLPTESELYCVAIRLTKDGDFRPKAKAILGNDWRMTLCQQQR